MVLVAARLAASLQALPPRYPASSFEAFAAASATVTVGMLPKQPLRAP